VRILDGFSSKRKRTTRELALKMEEAKLPRPGRFWKFLEMHEDSAVREPVEMIGWKSIIRSRAGQNPGTPGKIQSNPAQNHASCPGVGSGDTREVLVEHGYPNLQASRQLFRTKAAIAA